MLDISHSESSFLEGKAKYERFQKEFLGRFHAPLGVAQLAMMSAAITPEVKEQLAAMNPQATQDFDELVNSLTGGNNNGYRIGT